MGWSCGSFKVVLIVLVCLALGGLMSAQVAQVQADAEADEGFLDIPEWAQSNLFNLDLWGQPPPEWGGELPQSDLFGLSLWESVLVSPDLPPPPITPQLTEEFTLPKVAEFPSLEPVVMPSSPDFDRRKESVESSFPCLEDLERSEKLLSRDFTGLEESGKMLGEHHFSAEDYFDAIMTFSFNPPPLR